jgi:hypothetical protein
MSRGVGRSRGAGGARLLISRVGSGWAAACSCLLPPRRSGHLLCGPVSWASSPCSGECSRARRSETGRVREPQRVGVEPQELGDDRQQRRRVKAEVGGTLGLRQDVAFQEPVQNPAQLGRRRPGAAPSVIGIQRPEGGLPCQQDATAAARTTAVVYRAGRRGCRCAGPGARSRAARSSEQCWPRRR